MNLQLLFFATFLLFAVGASDSRLSFVKAIEENDSWPDFSPVSSRPLPSFILSNWKDSIIAWSGPRKHNFQTERDIPGLYYYAYDNGPNVLETESYSVIQNSDYSKFDMTNSRLFDGDIQLTRNGKLMTHSSVYSGTQLEFSLTKSYIFPQNKHFYIVEYHVKNLENKTISMSLLDYVFSPTCANNITATKIQSQLIYDLRNCQGKSLFFGTTPFASDNVEFTFSVNTPTKIIEEFRNNQPSNIPAIENESVALGTKASFRLGPYKDVYFSFVRSQSDSYQQLTEELYAATTFNATFWTKYTSDSVQNWLDKGVKSSDLNLSEEQKMFYDISLLTTKHSQNPTNGAIVASFHSSYEFKVWSRDAAFSCLILDAAGFHEEAQKFLEWLSTVELCLEGYLHTCYSWFTSSPVGFVEPQYDGVGVSLTAFYLHYKLVKDKNWMNKVKPRIRELENFILNNKGYENLLIPDYSIWEESSDHYTGEPFPTSYYGFSQSYGYSGMKAASFIESEVFDDENSASRCKNRAEEIKNAVRNLFWSEDRQYYMRNLNSETLQFNQSPDASTNAIIFTGLELNPDRILNHLNLIVANLTKLEYGVARYWNDPYFYDSRWNPAGQNNHEAQEPSPPWGVTTMFTLWAETAALRVFDNENVMKEPSKELKERIQQRLQWMVDFSARPMMGTGEAIDSVSTEIVMSSSPDIYEHCGVYVYSCLLINDKTPLPSGDDINRYFA